MQAVPYVDIVDDLPPVGAESTLGVAELLLKDPARVDRMTRDEARLVELIPRFLALALASFSIYSVAMAVVLHFVPTAAMPSIIADYWAGGAPSTITLRAPYAFGTVLAKRI